MRRKLIIAAVAAVVLCGVSGYLLWQLWVRSEAIVSFGGVEWTETSGNRRECAIGKNDFGTTRVVLFSYCEAAAGAVHERAMIRSRTSPDVWNTGVFMNNCRIAVRRHPAFFLFVPGRGITELDFDEEQRDEILKATEVPDRYLVSTFMERNVYPIVTQAATTR